MMRIAYITSQFPYGPNEAFLSAELQALAQYTGDIVIIPTRPKSRTPVHETFGLESLFMPPFGLSALIGAALEILFNPGRVWSAFKAVAGSRCRRGAKFKNILIFPKAVAVAREIRRRRVTHIHAHWLSTPSTVAYVASLLTDVPWSCTAHRFDIFSGNMLSEKAGSAQFIRAISERNRTLLVTKIPDREAGARCRVIHMGVTLPSRIRHHDGDGALAIVCAANLVEVKGHRYLLEALAHLKRRGIPFECHLAGDGPLKSAIESLARKLGIEKSVRLRGKVDHDRLCAELSSGVYNVAVLASTEEGETFEGVPVALIEAMAAGVPCVATHTGSIPELIDDERCSSLVSQRDPAALAEALADLYVNAGRRSEIARAARRRVEEAFDARVTSRQLYELMCTS